VATKKSFTITEAAKKLGISRQAVHKAIAAGTLKARKRQVVKIEWQIPGDALRAYSVSGAHQSAGKKNS
jgi:hypothetical protein